MLAVVLILLERGVGDERHRLVARAAEVAAKVAEKKEEARAAVSSLVSWVKAKSGKFAVPETAAETAPKPTPKPTRVTDVPTVLALALRLLCARFPPREPRASSETLLPLLGDVAMVVTTLSMGRDEESLDHVVLAQQKEVVGVLAWRLFCLFDHPDRDVQRGAIAQWVALLNTARWLEREAFGESPLLFNWQPLHAGNLTATSYGAFVEAHHADTAALFRTSIELFSMHEEESLRSEADAWVATFTREQGSRRLGCNPL
jgi:hypothetical protein